MGKRSDQIPSALKHGVYSGMRLLPGEDSVAFEKLRKGLIADLSPDGPIVHDAVEDMARLLWRKQNLLTYGLAARAKERYSEICSVLPSVFSMPLIDVGTTDKLDPDELRALQKTVDARIQAELGLALELVELDDVVTIDYLMKELEVLDRLNGMIDRCLKRILFARGVKSISSASSTEPSQSHIKKLSAA